MAQMKIKALRGWEILDSRGNPTVTAEAELEDGTVGTASAPSGASTGSHEAHELRDGDPARYGGRGAQKAAGHIGGELCGALRGMDCADQRALDERLRETDGTRNLSRLGANAVLAASLACAAACANARRVPLWRVVAGLTGRAPSLPNPMMNILNGGMHARNNLDVQEFMILPSERLPFAERVEQCVRVYRRLGKLLEERGFTSGVGDEGGFAPDLAGDEDALRLILQAVEAAGLRPGEDITLGLDAAASGWTIEGGAYLPPKAGRPMTADQLVERWKKLCAAYPIRSLEDGAGEDDWQSWKKLTLALGKQVQLVGDDLFVTSVRRLRRGVEEGCANAILIKPNQIGTLSETLDAVAAAQEAGYGVILSHRSGETCDTAIADIAVGTGCGQIKAGAPCRGERTAKYSRLLRIASELTN